MNRSLALANACLTTASVVCAVLGFVAIRRRRVRRHARLMRAAVGFAALFLVLFVTRYVCFGITEFRGRGAARAFYFIVWFTHEPLAVLSVPLVLATVVLAQRKSFETHREVARITFPIWMYASVSGMLIYLLVYVLPWP